MKLFNFSIFALAVLAPQVHAENISLRLNYSESRTGLNFVPIHAQLGSFGLTPSLPDHADGPTLRVVAKNSKGVVIHQTNVTDTRQFHAEAFNQKTGKIEISQTVMQNNSVVQVSMPYDKDIASIEVLSQESNSKSIAANQTPMAKFDRAAIDKLVTTSKLAKTTSLAAGITATDIRITGLSDRRMDMVFIGDGYTAAEMGKWHNDAQALINSLNANSLWAANAGSINIRRVDVISNQSGVSEPDKGIYRDTALGSYYYCGQVDRAMCSDQQKVYATVGAVIDPDAQDVIIVVANSTRYGGAVTGSVVTLPTDNTASSEVLLHELGHAAFNLADEYDYGTCNLSYEPSQGNVSLNGTRNVKWSNQIPSPVAVPTPLGSYPGTVGVFQGGQYCSSGKYRPTETSKMRDLYQPYYAVNESLALNAFRRFTTPPRIPRCSFALINCP